MVTWTNNEPRETYIANRWKPKKANVAPINPGQDDRRSAYLRKSFADNVNATRQHRATWENPDWILSQGPDFFTNRENLSKAKPVLSQLKGNQDFWTTDQDESRNMYQMVMNNMRGGKGAQMLDMRGLPWAIQRDPNKYRRGRTLFQDPSKSAGFRADLRNMLGDLTFQNKRLDPENRTSNPAAVRASTWNPLHTTGYGKDFSAQEFPITNAIENVLDTGGIWGLLAGNILPKRKRKVLPSDRSWIPDGLGEFNEMDYIPFMGEFEEDITETIDDGDIWESAAVEEVDFIPTDKDIKEAYEYIFKDSAYSDEFVGNSAIIDTRVPSFEQYLEAMQKPEYYEYINSTLKSKAKAEEMGLI